MENTDNLQAFAARLRSTMKRRNVTLREVAAAVGKSISTVGAWTQAKNFPEVEVQRRLATYLNEPVAWLIHGVTEGKEITDKPVKYVAEEATDYGKPDVKVAAADEAEARRLFEEVISMAQTSPSRMGWLIEQVRLHLRPPVHWHRHNFAEDPDSHPAVQAAVRAAHEKAESAGLNQPASPRPRSAGAGQ